MSFVDFAPHNMTTDSLPVPYVASASTFLVNYNPYQAFDGSFAGAFIQWITNAVNTGWLKIDVGAGNEEYCGSYAIQNDSAGFNNRSPKNWTVQGSNNDSDWDVLDTVTGETGWANGEKRTFTCDTITTQYRYFKIDVTANNGDTYLTIGEIYLFNTTEIPAVTVGGSGTDYPGVTGLDDAIAAEGTFANDIKYEVHGHVNLTAGKTFDQQGYTLTITSDTDPLGDPNSGWIVTLTGGINLTPQFQAGNIVIEKLGFSGNALTLGFNTQCYFTVKNCIFNETDLWIADIIAVDESIITENLFYKSTLKITVPAVSNALITIENNFCYHPDTDSLIIGGGANWTASDITIRDNCFFRPTGSAIVISSVPNSYPEAYNNCTKDNNINFYPWSVSSGNVPNVDPAANIQSLDIASSLYGKLIVGTKAGGVYTPGAADIGQAGVVPVHAGATDAAGNARPGADGDYSIGAFEQQYIFAGFNAKMIQDKIVITNDMHNRFSFGLNFALDE